MKSFNELMLESTTMVTDLAKADMKTTSYSCAMCKKKMEVSRPKFKHGRKIAEDSGKGIVIGKAAYCKKCVKEAIGKASGAYPAHS